MKTKELIAEAVSLPVEERALLVDSLLRSSNMPEPDIDKKWIVVTKDCLQQLRASEVTAIPNKDGLKNMAELILESIIQCPECGFKKQEAMPTDACIYFYQCTHCQALLKPKQGDCCVFCSYGTVACPPIQAGQCCCSN